MLEINPAFLIYLKKQNKSKKHMADRDENGKFLPNNQIWKLAKYEDIFLKDITPRELWDKSIEYFKWCDENPLYEIDYKGKDATKVQLPKMRPYTLKGLSLFIGMNEKYIRDLKYNKSKNENGENEIETEFNDVLTRVLDIIYTQKYEGAASGFLNPMLVMRDLGIKENTEINANINSNSNAVKKIVFKKFRKDENESNE